MKLSWKARLVWAAAVSGGLVCLAAAAPRAWVLLHMGGIQWAIVAALAVPTAWNWFSPLLLYRGSQSEAFQFDECTFVVAALLLPPAATVCIFALTCLAAQIVKRRPPVKLFFNLGQILVSVSLGLLASRAIAIPLGGARLTALQLLAAGVGAGVYFVVNSGLVAAMLVTLGSTWRECLIDGLSVRMYMDSTGVLFGVLVAAGASIDGWCVVMIPLVMATLRAVIGAQFKAEHDRERLQGLFDLTLKANSRLRYESVLESLVADSVELLRCTHAEICELPPPADQLSAPLKVHGQRRWLVASGRPPGRPFDSADHGLLRALAAVGEGALTNAELYRQVHHERSRLQSISLSIGEGVCAVDAQGRLTFVNPAAAAMVQLPTLSLRIDDTISAQPLLAPDFLLVPAREVMESGEVKRGEERFTGRDGASFPVAFTASAVKQGGRVTGAVIAFQDITEQKSLRDELNHHAFNDVLTGLANRRRLVEELHDVLEESKTDGKTHALIFLDVDRFKAVNDSLGHGTGDDLLVSVAARMRQAVRKQDLLARFGGDEFVLLLKDITGVDEAETAARRLCASVEEPLVLRDGYEIVASLSVGIALTEPGQSADDTIRDADVAMYKAKGRGGTYQVFDKAEMGTRSSARLDLETALRKGIDRGELEVHYQPLFSIADMGIVGAEALVRWRHPVEGLIRPDQFIPMAEETGLILPVGRYVLEQTCLQIRAIRDRLGFSIPVNVNLSPRQFQQANLMVEVALVLNNVGLPSELLRFEITESMVMDDLVGAKDAMWNLRRLGVGLAIDDFGTGHSSLGYLKQFPVDEVKVDRIFVKGVLTDKVDTAIVQAVVNLANAMDISAVAEGIETADQLEGLRRLGCHQGQGYYFARPMPAPQFGALLESHFAPSHAAGARPNLRVV